MRGISDMRFVYPYVTESDGDSTVIEFPDVAGAVTQVDPDENFDEIVQDCLIAALGGYIAIRQAPPNPSAAKGRNTVTLNIMTSAKLALALAMSEKRMSNVAMGRQLGVTEKVVRRMLDLDHVSKIDGLENALGLLDRKLELIVKPMRRRADVSATAQ